MNDFTPTGSGKQPDSRTNSHNIPNELAQLLVDLHTENARLRAALAPFAAAAGELPIREDTVLRCGITARGLHILPVTTAHLKQAQAALEGGADASETDPYSKLAVSYYKPLDDRYSLVVYRGAGAYFWRIFDRIYGRHVQAVADFHWTLRESVDAGMRFWNAADSLRAGGAE